ncbi:MAG: YihY/virulence factor BrkB family protein [Butyrivibrio sp.]|nr:YihY/virulence factor BrkB family protein [Butyrivibrio sp.]
MTLKKQLIRLAKEFTVRMNSKYISAFAGSTAFFFITSIIPMLIVVSSLLPYTGLTQKQLIQIVTDITPYFVDDLMTQIIGEAFDQSVGVLSMSIIIMIWSGATAMMAIIRGLNFIDDVVETRNYFLLRFVAAIYTFVMLIVIVIMMGMLVFWETIKEFILDAVPQLIPYSYRFHDLRYPIAMAVSFFLFALVYTYVPTVRLKFRYQLPGALFTSFAWSIFSMFFSIYVTGLNKHSFYGSMTAPIIAMLWLYFCIYIFFIGAFLNRFFHPAVKVFYNEHHKRKLQKQIEKKTGRKK